MKIAIQKTIDGRIVVKARTLNHPPLKFQAPIAAANKPIEVQEGSFIIRLMINWITVPDIDGMVKSIERNKTIVAINIEINALRQNTDRRSIMLLIWTISFNINLLKEKDTVSIIALITRIKKIKKIE